MSNQKTIKWTVGPWKNGGYEIQYRVNGIVNCTFIGTPDERSCVFRLRFHSRSPYGEVPKTRTLSYFDVNKEVTA